MISVGAAPKALQLVMGHASAAFTLIGYGHLSTQTSTRSPTVWTARTTDFGVSRGMFAAWASEPTRAQQSSESLTCSNDSGPPGNRTPDHRIKSPLLCQLS
jgi:hypothetical protein